MGRIIVAGSRGFWASLAAWGLVWDFDLRSEVEVEAEVEGWVEEEAEVVGLRV